MTNLEYVLKSDGTFTDKEAFQNINNSQIRLLVLYTTVKYNVVVLV